MHQEKKKGWLATCMSKSCKVNNNPKLKLVCAILIKAQPRHKQQCSKSNNIIGNKMYVLSSKPSTKIRQAKLKH